MSTPQQFEIAPWLSSGLTDSLMSTTSCHTGTAEKPGDLQHLISLFEPEAQTKPLFQAALAFVAAAR